MNERIQEYHQGTQQQIYLSTVQISNSLSARK